MLCKQAEYPQQWYCVICYLGNDPQCRGTSDVSITTKVVGSSWYTWGIQTAHRLWHSQEVHRKSFVNICWIPCNGLKSQLYKPYPFKCHCRDSAEIKWTPVTHIYCYLQHEYRIPLSEILVKHEIRMSLQPEDNYIRIIIGFKCHLNFITKVIISELITTSPMYTSTSTIFK